jgi:hypothetical protein
MAKNSPVLMPVRRRHARHGDTQPATIGRRASARSLRIGMFPAETLFGPFAGRGPEPGLPTAKSPAKLKFYA